MSEKTKIAWTDSTINFWSGCTKISAGCANCYAEARDSRMLQEKISHWGKGAPRLKHKGAVKNALALNRAPWVCDTCGDAYQGKDFPASDPTGKGHYCGIKGCQGMSWHRRKIFSLSLGDWLDNEVPIEWLVEMLETIFKCKEVIWILCTKRTGHFGERLRKAMEIAERKDPYDPEPYRDGSFCQWLEYWENGCEVPQNVWILASVENQEVADLRILDLINIPAKVHGLSVEPMLGPIDFIKWIGTEVEGLDLIDWMIFGGESGPDARPCDIDWIRDGVKQCRAADVKVFVKQMGENAVMRDGCFVSEFSDEVAKAIANQPPKPIKFEDKKGGDINEWPDDLKVREFPV